MSRSNGGDEAKTTTGKKYFSDGYLIFNIVDISHQ